MNRRIVPGRRTLLAVVVLVLLLVGHLWFWYLPRAHDGQPAAGSAVVALLAAGGFDGAVWLPYPHQNLAAIPGDRDPWSYWDAADVLSRRDRLSMLSFGPFVVPPSKEMGIAWTTGGERFAVAARVYPLFTAIASSAGWVARNPWLAGGEVEGVHGKVRVRWQGTLWTATTEPPVPAPASAAPALPAGEVLALLRLGDPPPRLPAGLFVLRRTAEGLAVDRVDAQGRIPAEDAPLKAALLEPAAVEPPLVLLGLAAGEGREQALALFESGEVPGFAVFERGAASPRLPLAGMGVAAFLGQDGYRGEVSDWTVLATGAAVYERAEALVPAIAGGFEAPAPPAVSRLRLAVVADPAAAGRVVDHLVLALGALPAADGEEGRRLTALRQLLVPIAGFRRGSLVVLADPDRFELRLER